MFDHLYYLQSKLYTKQTIDKQIFYTHKYTPTYPFLEQSLSYVTCYSKHSPQPTNCHPPSTVLIEILIDLLHKWKQAGCQNDGSYTTMVIIKLLTYFF